MHGLIINVTLNDPDEATKLLREQVVPMTKESPGFVTGYWLREGNSGMAMIIFESEDAANAMMDQMRSQGPPSDAVTLDNVEVRQVEAHA
jgi:hypothetical protein